VGSGVYLFAFLKKIWRGSEPSSTATKNRPAAPVVVSATSEEMQIADHNARGRVDRIGIQSTTPPASPAAGTPVSPSGIGAGRNQEPEIHTSERRAVGTSDWVEKTPEPLQPAIDRPSVIFTDCGTNLTGHNSPRVKHPIAVYLDETGGRITVSYKEADSVI
jgi:hypothetical protein